MPRLILSLCLLASLTGCNPYLYINVPAQYGDLARNDPNADIVRTVEVAALRHMLALRPLEAPTAIKLPEPSTDLTYADIARRAGGEGAVVPIGEAEDAPTRVEITQVRIRGVFAEIDMMYPTVSGMPQLLTVYLEYKPMSDWMVDRVQDWPGATHPVDHGGLVAP